MKSSLLTQSPGRVAGRVFSGGLERCQYASGLLDWWVDNASVAFRLLADAIDELPLMFQREQHDLYIGVRVQNHVLCHDILTQER